ncbi:MAG: hypothetical protein ACREC0_07800 [Methylocella sp.]
MMFAKAGIIALVIGAGLVGRVSFANAQIAVVNQKLEAFKYASLGQQTKLPGESRLGGVLGRVEQNQRAVTDKYLKNALSDSEWARMKKGFADQLNDAIRYQDATAQALADAITKTMKTMGPNNQQDGKRLEQVFEEILAINKTTTDALLRYSEYLALLEEQAVAGAQKQ